MQQISSANPVEVFDIPVGAHIVTPRRWYTHHGIYDAYDVLRNNCEHFCFWCLAGAARSPQVERLLLNPRAVALAAQVLGGLIKMWHIARDTLPLTN